MSQNVEQENKPQAETIGRNKPGPFAGVLYTLPGLDRVKYQPMVFKTDPATGAPTEEKLHHEFWRLRPSPSFKRTDGKGVVYVNCNISFRRLKGEEVLGPRFPMPGKTVVVEGWVEKKYVKFTPADGSPEYNEEHLLVVLFVTDKPVEEATQIMKFPQVADGDLNYGDVRIPMTGHAIRFQPKRVKPATKTPAAEQPPVKGEDDDDMSPEARNRWRLARGK